MTGRDVIPLLQGLPEATPFGLYLVASTLRLSIIHTYFKFLCLHIIYEVTSYQMSHYKQ